MGDTEFCLAHHGIKDQRWGVRRYQYKDGSLTDAGRKRYARDLREGSKKNGKEPQPDPSRWVREDLKRSKRVTDEMSGLTNKIKKSNDTSIQKKSQNRPKLDLSSMSDKQMRDEINRAMLERQYNDLFAPKNVSKGRQIVSSILEGAGTALAIGSSALGIALAIKDLTGR